MSYMTPEQAAIRLGTTTKDVLRMAQNGILKSIEQNGKTMISRNSVLMQQSSGGKYFSNRNYTRNDGSM